MSGLSTAKAKLKEGASWRGEINVTIDDEDISLTIRQLRDPEFEEVMGKIQRDELQELRGAYPDDVMERVDELEDKDELTDEEQAELEECREEMQDADVDIFEYLSTSTFEGIRLAAIYGIEPDDDDKREALRERATEIEREYGHRVQDLSDVEVALQDDIEEMIRNSTDFYSFRMGMQVLTETVGTEGN